jgi:phospholipid/cholesterol/gamma-HCH transport system substrate-binding protein
MKLRVGLFVLLFLINVLVIVGYIVIEKGTFSKRYSYNFRVFSAESFHVGMPIELSGFKIGRIDKIKLLDDGSVRISFSVDRENRRWVCKQSVLMIRKPLIGSYDLTLYPAVCAPPMQEGSTLEVYSNDDINDIIQNLKPIITKMNNIVNSVEKITEYLARDDSEVVKIIKNMEKFSSTLAQNKPLLTTITGDQNATDALIGTIHNINNMTTDVHKDILPPLSTFIKQLGIIAKDIKSKLKRLDRVVNENEIDNLKESIQTGIAKSNEILEKIDTLFLDERNSEVILP